MKTLVFGAGPIGRWLALRLHAAGKDVTLLARNETYLSLERDGIEIVDGLTRERLVARVPLVGRLDPGDRYELVVVAMSKGARPEVCPILARNRHAQHVLFVGNDVSGFRHYTDHLSPERFLLGFPRAGGGWDGCDLVVMDRERRGARHGTLHIGELDGTPRARTRAIAEYFESADVGVSLERDIDGWLKYHFAFMAPTAGAIFMKGGDPRAVADDPEAIRLFCRACREAGDVLRAVGHRRRQPPVFNLFYWLPRRMEPTVFAKLFRSPAAQVQIRLHLHGVGPELLEMAEEFAELRNRSGIETPALDALLEHVPRSQPVAGGTVACS